MNESDSPNIGNPVSLERDVDENPPSLKRDVVINSLELGDVIMIHAYRNTNIDQQTYYVYYIDELKLKLLNTSNHQLLLLNIDGYVADESITSIDLLSRSEVPGFARQHKLLPPQWIDVHFNGEVPVIVSGEITNLEEDMIEITTYPGMRVIYIDFAYQGMPESLPIEKIVLREKPKSITTSLRSIMDGTTELTREEAEAEATVEFDEQDGQMIVRIPETAMANPSPNEIVEEYLQNDVEIPLADGEEDDGELAALDMFFEVRESDRRYSEEIQLSDLLGELVSKLPVEKRTPVAMKDIHRFVTRFRELRRVFSVFDDNGDVVMPRATSILHKPIIDHIVNLDRDIKWIMPVTYERNELISHTTARKSDHYEEAPTHTETEMSDFVENLINAQREFSTTTTEANKYDAMMATIDTLCAPAAGKLDPAPEDIEIYMKDLETKTATELIVSNDYKYQMDSSVSAGDSTHATGKNILTVRRYVGASSRQVLDETTKRRTFYRKPIGSADRANIRSIIMLPRSVLMQSQSVSPSANIYMKTKMAEIPVYKFRLLNSKKLPFTRFVTDINKELAYEDSVVSLKNPIAPKDKESAAKDKSPEVPNPGEPFLDIPTHYVIGDEITSYYPDNEDTFRQFLNAIIPRTRTLIRWMRPSIKHLYSFVDVVSALEPFFVESEDITFKQYIEIRYYIKEKIRQYAASIATARNTYDVLKGINKTAKTPINRVHSIISEQKDFEEYLFAIYRLGGETTPDLTSSETLQNILQMDGADAYSTILNLYLMEFLTIPESIAGVLKPPTISSDDANKVLKSKCDRRFIAKKYRSVAEMRKDDNTSDVFYDKEFDDTPYHLLDKYKDDKKRFREETQFREFFIETLIQKHDCPPHLAPQLANSILDKKKRISNGEYAILEIKPTLGDKLTEERMSLEDEREAEDRKLTEFYRRNRDKWVLDESVDMTSFLDTNTLFCELSASCNKITDVNQCVPNDMAALQMRLSRRAKIIEEFDDRVARTFQEVAEELRAGVSQKYKQNRRKFALNNAKLYKQNSYSYELGKYAKSTDTVIESPHVELRERILGWSDFVAKQTMIYHFVKKHCRYPNPHMQEDANWMYCVDTNSKLFPESIFNLASAFIYDDYSRVLDQTIRDIGELSDDGDAIVDKHTGYVLRKIDYSAEEGFDEAGFRINTNAMVEETDIEAMVMSALASTTNTNKVFENPTAQSAYNVFRVLAENMGIQKDTTESSIEEFVLRISLEMMNDRTVVMAEEPYNEQLALEAAGQTKRKTARMPYTTYFNQILIIIVSCATFAAMQTLIPSFKTNKTFPGCVKSFAGFPLDANSENTPGLKYIACVLDKSKRASSLPWSAIEPLGVETLLKRMKTIMQNYIYVRPDVQKLYEVKRDYMVNYPDNDVPDEVAIQKWVHFMPPVVPFSIAPNTVTGISEEYEKELFKVILQGSTEQFNTLGIIKGKLLKHGYLVYNIIDLIVRKKQLLLLSSGGAAFLENACCNEDGTMTNPIVYFRQEQPDLTQVLQKAKKMERTMDMVKNLTKAKMLYDPKSSRIVGAPIPDTIISRVIYETYIHFCNFDNDVAIPADLIPLAAVKPEYNRFASIDEKIAFMKKHGKTYGIEDFHSIMRVVNTRNMVNLKPDKEIGALNGLKDMLNYFDDKNSNLVEERLRELLRLTLDEYNPKVAVHEERPNNNKLNRYLLRANEGMRDTILAFLDTHANLNLGNLDKMSAFLENAAYWKIDDTATAIKEIYNMIYNISKVYPNKTLANNFSSGVPSHWNFSFAHKKYLEDTTKEFYSNISAMCDEKPDSVFNKCLATVVSNLTDLVLFVEQIPVFAPLIRQSIKYWSLYSDTTVFLLYQYAFLSAVHEYVILANDRQFIQMRAEEIKQNQIKRNAGEELGVDLGEEYGAQIHQVHIVDSDSAELKRLVAKWLSAVLNRERETKTAFNRNYKEIMDSTTSLKYKDKKGITDYLAALSRDERRVEQTLRSHKIGRWNVGMQKGLYQYEKNVYDKEIGQWHSEEEGGGVGEDVEDLERTEQMQQSADYDQGDGWEDLNEDYMDGVFYEEDAERDGDF